MPPAESTAAVKLPTVMREFRAAWVATVDNIDWPSRPGLPADSQQQEIIAILDTAAALGLNAIIFQARPQCDALYSSNLEPWSYYLSGQQGVPPAPVYDPLAFWIEAAHDRGIELHAWFNPYRAHHPKGGPISEYSIVKQKPELAKNLNNGYYWLDPAKPETQDHSFSVIMDVVRRYDIDGVHFDDYFYPYGDGNFPDDETWTAYQQGGGKFNRKDWRREHVNRFIQRLYQAIKKEKPSVKFGISPFGIWRPGHPESIQGYDQYDKLYADARRWLNEGWIDYWSPQLYWPIKQIPQSYPVLLGWWVNENHQNRHLWPGMYTGKAHREKKGNEIINQIMINRGFVPEAPGHIHFSMKTLLKNRAGINDSLRGAPYQQAALAPAFPWLDSQAPMAPHLQIDIKNDSILVHWSHENESDIFRWIVYVRTGDSWIYHIFNRNVRDFSLPHFDVPAVNKQITPSTEIKPETDSLFVTQIAVSAVDRMGNESQPVFREIETGSGR